MVATSGNVLVVDDDAALGRILVALLNQAGMTATHVSSGADALAVLDGRGTDVVITDLRMPGMDGMELLSRVRQRFTQVPVIVLTAHGSVPLAVEAIKKGASDFVLKPFDRDEIVFVVGKALLSARHAESVPDSSPVGRGPLTSASPVMRDACELIERAARGNATVLIRGESGTGKELAAQAIHDLGPRSKGPFVKIHCAALPDSLLESELFGYEKGAFTGATGRKLGRIELADGGTLFLDEIGDITPPTQVKLLRVLQERELERLGGTGPIKVDVRVVAATHRDLEAMVEKKEFREDLFYRLNVVPIWLPPLRARPEDVEPLVRRFCQTLGPPNGKPALEIEPSAIDTLRAQTWPGNVRQLQNFVERLIVLGDGPMIRCSDVERELSRSAPFAQPTAPSGGGGNRVEPATLEAGRREAEHEALIRALQSVAGNRAKAARVLGVSRRTLYNKLAEHGLQ